MATVQEQPVGDLLVQRQREDEEADVAVEQRVGDAEVAAGGARARAAASRRARRCGRPPAQRRPRAPDTRAGGSRRSRRRAPLVARQPGVTGCGALDDPEVGEQEGRRAEPGEAAREPLAGEHASRTPLLSELVEPQPLGLELRHDAREQPATSPSTPSSSADRTRGLHHQRPRLATSRRDAPRGPAARTAR